MRLCPRCRSVLSGKHWDCRTCGFVAPLVRGFSELAPDLADGGGGFDPALFSELASLESGSFWFRARNRLIVWALTKFKPELRCYLEIGCGTGFALSAVARAFPETRLTGSEIFVAGLPFAAQRVKDAELIQMDARQVPFAEEFDAVGAFDVLEHIVEDEQVLAEVFRALCTGGAMVVTVPQHPWLWSAADEYAHHVRRYRVGELSQKVRHAGFEIAFDSSFVSLLLPLMIISRLRRTSSGRSTPPRAAELRLPAVLNYVLESIMAFERLGIRLGLRLPFGGSRLLVAIKPGGIG